MLISCNKFPIHFNNRLLYHHISIEYSNIKTQTTTFISQSHTHTLIHRWCFNLMLNFYPFSLHITSFPIYYHYTMTIYSLSVVFVSFLISHSKLNTQNSVCIKRINKSPYQDGSTFTLYSSTLYLTRFYTVEYLSLARLFRSLDTFLAHFP